MPTTFTRRACLHAMAAAGLAASHRAFAATDDIVLGQSAHLSGPLASTLTAVLKGQALALDQLNRKGGIAGRPVRLVTLDDAYDPKRCAENVKTLVERDKVIALTGLASTANVAAVLPLLAEKRVPLVGVYTGAPALRRQQHPYFFTALASYRDEVVEMVRNLATVQRSRIAIAYHDSPFGQLMLPVVEEVVKEQGGTLVAKQALAIAGQNSVDVCAALAASQPQAVIFMAFGPALVPFMRAARSQIGVPIYAPSIANSKQLLAALGDDGRGLVLTQIVPYPMRVTTPLTRDFAAVMQEADLPIDFDHFFGYLNMRVVFEALRRAGKGVSSQGLVAAIEGMGRVDLGGYTVTFGPKSHHGSNFVDLMMVGPGGRYIR